MFKSNAIKTNKIAALQLFTPYFVYLKKNDKQ